MENTENTLEYKSPSKKHKKTSPLTIFYRVFCILLIFVSICFIAFNIIFDYKNISGESMQPTYNYPNVKQEDLAFYSSHFNYSIGDVIVAKKADYNIIKRLIAMEGDTFTLKKDSDGFFHIFVNDIMQDESYLLNLDQNEHLYNTIKNSYETSWKTKMSITITENLISFIVPQDYCFYLGDNRLESYDCADYGPTLIENITHKVIFVIPYGENFITYWWKRIFS